VGVEVDAAVERIAAVADVAALVHQVQRSTERVSEIVLALKRYTYLGQVEVPDVDIHQGLDDTLLILGHKLTAAPGSSVITPMTSGPFGGSEASSTRCG